MTGWKLAALLLASALISIPTRTFADGPSSAGSARPWMDAKLSAKVRTDSLLSQMTLDEKIRMLHAPMAMPFGPITMPPGAVGSAGFLPGNDRLGIPALQESDASLGVVNPMMVRGSADMSTALPSGLLLASTFDPALAFMAGRAVGNEARAKALNVQLAGGVNLARDPRNGRNFEYLGEDPLLAGILAGEGVRGVQSAGIIATVKHFALNDQETHRSNADAQIDEVAARESDLLAFEIAIERGRPGSVMCSYNLVNGIHACESQWLLSDVLKHDWDYQGFVMSDWGAVNSLNAFVKGLDQQSGEQLDKQVFFAEPLKQAVISSEIPIARVDDAVRRILRAIFEAGLFDRPPERSGIDFSAHGIVARREAEEGIVLLQNRANILPLAASAKRIAIIGGHADAGVPSGTGSSQVSNAYRVDPTQPIVSVPQGGDGLMASIANVAFHPSSPLVALRARLENAQISFDRGFYPEAAAQVARNADVAIVFVYQLTGEGEDVPNLDLPMGQDALISAVAAANPNTVVVIESGNPVAVPWADKVGAIIEAWFSGSQGGEAIADVLTGAVNPSGRLPISWPVDERQLPRAKIPGWGAEPNERITVDYNIEGADIGYRWFARQNLRPQYWFGYGLSYTNFQYTSLTIRGGKTVSAEVSVCNLGKRAGKELVQLYLTQRPNGRTRRLVGFKKVELAPRENRRIKIDIDSRLLADYNAPGHGWALKGGYYLFAIAKDAGSLVLEAGANVNAAAIKP